MSRTNHERCLYLRPDFFYHESNKFWLKEDKKPFHTQESRDYFEKCNAERAKRLERNLK